MSAQSLSGKFLQSLLIASGLVSAMWMGSAEAASKIPSSRSVAEVAAFQEITEVIYRYCFGVDHRDTALTASVWHKGGTIDTGAGNGFISADKFAQSMSNPRAPGSVSSHQVTNIAIKLNGDKATSESYVLATYRQVKDAVNSDRVIIARYLDQWSFKNGRWAIDERKAVVDIAYPIAGVPAPPAAK